jgi:hypothetical protein
MQYDFSVTEALDTPIKSNGESLDCTGDLLAKRIPFILQSPFVDPTPATVMIAD